MNCYVRAARNCQGHEIEPRASSRTIYKHASRSSASSRSSPATPYPLVQTTTCERPFASQHASKTFSRFLTRQLTVRRLHLSREGTATICLVSSPAPAPLPFYFPLVSWPCLFSHSWPRQFQRLTRSEPELLGNELEVILITACDDDIVHLESATVSLYHKRR